MGRLVQSNTTVGLTQEYTKFFTTTVWGGSVQSFTVPPGVSQIKLTAVAVGGCLAGSTTTSGMNGAANNVIFARLNGIDPPFVSFAKSSTFFSIGLAGKYVYGSIINSDASGINGDGDVSNTSRMSGNYFNALDVNPWSIVVSQGNTTAQQLSTSTDGFNFTHTTISTSTAPILYSCVFGGNGQAMVAIGNTANSNVYYTANYGEKWTNLINYGVPTRTSRLRYLNGTWIACTGSDSAFFFTTTPISATGLVNVWVTSNAMPAALLPRDVGWTGTTYIVAMGNATNVAICTTLTGTWVNQAHGGDLSFNTCESGNGEVLLFENGPSLTSATSLRGTSGTATNYNSINAFAVSNSGLKYDAAKSIPFISGGMWVLGNVGTSLKTTTSVVTASINSLAIITPINGNTLVNNTAVNNVQYIGSNYCSLGSTNGLGKFSSAGVLTANLSTATELTTEFGYISTVLRSPDFVIAKNGTEVLQLQGGGTANVNLSGKGGGKGGGNSVSGSSGGRGQSGIGSASTLLPLGNGGGTGYSGTYGGGGTWNAKSMMYAPQENSLVPGASGGGSSNAVTSGGGGSLFSMSNTPPSSTPTYSLPALVFNRSTNIGSPGGGAHGVNVLATTAYSAGGGAEGCYKYSLDCLPGDTFTLTLPGACYVYADGSNGTNGGPGGESYAMIQYNA